jgi:hypothetical protein
MFRNIGYILAVIGVLLISLDLVGILPMLTGWTYSWGVKISWVIRIGFIVLGLVLMFMGREEPRD